MEPTPTTQYAEKATVGSFSCVGTGEATRTWWFADEQLGKTGGQVRWQDELEYLTDTLGQMARP